MTVNPQVSLLDLGPETCITGHVMWSLIDGKYIVSGQHHNGLLVDMVDDGLGEEIDGMAADFAIWRKEINLAALDRITREVKRLSESVRKVNDR